MIEKKDRYAKIIAGTDEQRQLALKRLSANGKVAAERLINEPYLDVYIEKSSVKNMEHCAVVKCTYGILYSIHREILEPVTFNYEHSAKPVDRDEVLPEERFVRIPDALKQEAIDLLAYIGDEWRTYHIINAGKLILRKKKSGVVGLEDYSVIECPRGYLFPIPKRLLQTVNNG